MKSLAKLSIVLAAAATLAVGCSSGNNVADFATINPNNNPVATSTGNTTVNPGGATTVASTQVEQLARPAIAEGLLFTNANLAVYNSVGPDFIHTVLTNPSSLTSAQQAAATSVLTEAQTVLNITVINVGGGTPAQVTAIEGAFLPDVMRIDTSITALGNGVGVLPTPGVENQAYASNFNTAGSPVAGRKLTDDVIDDTLQVITLGAVSGDNVPYYKPTTGPGSANPQIGHHNLHGQTAQFGPSTWPYLADPN